MTQMLARSTAAVKPHVKVVPDGGLYRWQRFDGRTIRTSSERFTTPTAATETATVVAQCYSVPLLADAVPWATTEQVTREQIEAEIWADEAHEAWLADVLGDVELDAPYVPFQHPGAYYADIRFAEDRDDWVGA